MLFANRFALTALAFAVFGGLCFGADDEYLDKSETKKSTFEKFVDVPFCTKFEIPEDITDMVRKDRDADIAYIGSTSWSSWKSTPAFFTKKEIWNMVRLLKMVCPYVEDIKNENIAYVKANSKRPKAINGLTYWFTIAAFWFDELLQQLNLSVFRAWSRSTIAVPQRTAEVIKDIKPRVII